MKLFNNIKGGVNKLVLAGLFSLSIVILGVTFILPKANNPTLNNSQTTETSVNTAHLTPEELAAFDPNSLNVSVVSEIVLNNVDFTAPVNIRNIGNYDHYFIVDIILDDEVIYQTEEVFPNDVIEFITFDNSLSKGRYPVVVSFNAFDKISNEKVTTINFDIELSVVGVL